MQIIKAGFAYFGLVFGLGFLLGAVRVSLIVPRLGTRKAELLEAPLMLIGILLATQFILQQFVLPNTNSAFLIVGIIALGLMLFAEFLLIVWLQKQTITQ